MFVLAGVPAQARINLRFDVYHTMYTFDDVMFCALCYTYTVLHIGRHIHSPLLTFISLFIRLLCISSLGSPSVRVQPNKICVICLSGIGLHRPHAP